MTSAYVDVNGNPYLEITNVSCGDLFLQVNSITATYGGTVDCKIGFVNPHNQQVGVQLKDSSVLVDFPMSHSRAVISDKSTTTFPAHRSGYLHVKFSASISDFRALANYWVYGYYDLPVTMRLHLVEFMNNAPKSYNYTVRSHVILKTSNTVYGVVVIDIGSFIVSFIAGGESLKEVIIAAKAGKRAKTAWEILKMAQGFIRGITKRW
ncbi:hypothetical protein [Thermococcus sp. AM4]|uniref:hypothetical protein n=1 Tax=Thermococcus sp. (strain AM4) TaxID=246969 RepID=UPI0011D21781|nr:hypothetical protein [Thermococcus sp. AM4]